MKDASRSVRSGVFARLPNGERVLTLVGGEEERAVGGLCERNNYARTTSTTTLRVDVSELAVCVSHATNIPLDQLRLVGDASRDLRRSDVLEWPVHESVRVGNSHDESSDDVYLYPNDVQVLLRLKGGKGGFGALLRATRANRQRTTDTSSCRDLSGRRLRHLEAEQALREWEENREERERQLKENDRGAKRREERAKRKREEREKLTQDVAKELNSITNTISESVSAAVSSKRRRTGTSTTGSSTTPSGTGVLYAHVSASSSDESSDDDDDDDSDLDDLGDPFAAPLVATKQKSDDRDTGPTSSPPHVRDAEITPPSSSPSSSTGSPTSTTVDTPTAETTSPSATSNPPTLSVREKETTTTALLDLTRFKSARDLESVGLDRLKVELTRRGLKCGGTLEQRAERLWLLTTMSEVEVLQRHGAKKSNKK